ncbi:MAG: helix-turn-helix domain-containing protein [Candidatus Thiodiazotropha taylori]|nr:helix-turn-helix domain-containing protein [Candidatus Thiodiazotropha taylori]
MAKNSLKSLMKEMFDENIKFKENLKRLNPRVELARVLIYIRHSARMTQQQVAEAMGTDQPFVSRMESAAGPFPDASSISAYAHACHSGFGLVFVSNNRVIAVSMCTGQHEKVFSEAMALHNIEKYSPV